MVGHLTGDRVVSSLGHLVDQSHGVGVKPAGLEQIVGLLQHLRDLLSAEELVAVCPPLHGAGQQGVPEPVGARREALQHSGELVAGKVGVTTQWAFRGHIYHIFESIKKKSIFSKEKTSCLYEVIFYMFD